MELIVRTSSVGGRAVLAVAGEIDLATVPQLHNALARAVNDHADVIVDLDGVYACDDTGLGVLLGAAGRAREAGGDLVVVCSAGPFRSRLARTGFDRAVTVAETLAETFDPTLDQTLDQTPGKAVNDLAGPGRVHPSQ